MTAASAPRRRKKKATGRGGWRPGAGRKPKGEKAGVSHDRRSTLAARFPLHIVLETLRELPSLQGKAERAALLRAFAAGCRHHIIEELESFRLCHFAIHPHALHLVVEAADHMCLSRGMQGLLIRVARAVNKVWQRGGKLFADRYAAQPLHDEARVREVLAQLFGLADGAAKPPRQDLARAVALYTSAPWLGEPRDAPAPGASGPPVPVAAPRTSLLKAAEKRVRVPSAGA